MNDALFNYIKSMDDPGEGMIKRTAEQKLAVIRRLADMPAPSEQRAAVGANKSCSFQDNCEWPACRRTCVIRTDAQPSQSALVGLTFDLLPKEMENAAEAEMAKPNWTYTTLWRAMLAAHPVMKAASDGVAWHMVCGDWKEELVALHGPNGHIASGLTVEQAKALIEAHGGAAIIRRHEDHPTECSGDPTSCPENEGFGCACSDRRDGDKDGQS